MKFLRRFLLIILLLFVYGLLSDVMSIFLGGNYKFQSSFEFSIIEQIILMFVAVFSTLVILILLKKFILHYQFEINWKKKDIIVFFVALLIMEIIGHGGLFLLNYLKIGTTLNQDLLEQMFGSFNFFITLIIIGVCGPICEEVIFRAGIIYYLFEDFPFLGFIFSVIVFTVLQLPSNVVSLVMYGGVGLVLSLIYYKTKRLDLVIALHLVYNISMCLT
ncbi:CPBP family intramembrane glutamic endopeptidase [Streptococcus hongkongensis]|nr:hypothetical protein NC01_05120 [Streptococcus uberis]